VVQQPCLFLSEDNHASRSIAEPLEHARQSSRPSKAAPSASHTWEPTVLARPLLPPHVMGQFGARCQTKRTVAAASPPRAIPSRGRSPKPEQIACMHAWVGRHGPRGMWQWCGRRTATRTAVTRTATAINTVYDRFMPHCSPKKPRARTGDRRRARGRRANRTRPAFGHFKTDPLPLRTVLLTGVGGRAYSPPPISNIRSSR
jgi:hypothetical protein